MKSLIALVLFAPLFATAQTPVKWEPIKPGPTFSEGWKYDQCEVFVLEDGSGIEISVEVENYIDPNYPRRDGADVYYFPWALSEKIEITRDWQGTHVTLSAGEGTYFADRFNVDAPDMFYLHYREAAQSLPPNIKKMFHHLYGIEP